MGVPSLGDYTVNSFCVAKYEMKNDGSGNAVSQAASIPYGNITRDNSIIKCTEMGDGYDLITNDEWQSMVRNIELVESNWDGGTIGSTGGLNQGHSDKLPDGPLEASDDDNNSCYRTGQVCTGSSWYLQSRTHILSNGEIIWDVSGNVWEWVKDDNSDGDNGVYGDNAYMSQVTRTSHTIARSLSGGTTTTARVAKDQFGPSGDYLALNSDRRGGLGHGWLSFSRGAIARGGYWWNAIPNTGVFATVLRWSPTATSSRASGFRCVYYP